MSAKANRKPSPGEPHKSAFETEAALVKAIGTFLTSPSGRKFDLIAEHEAGFGRPDILLYRKACGNAVDEATLAMTPPRLAPLLSQRAAKLLCSIDALAAATGTSDAVARRTAKQLEALGRLYWISSSSFRILPITAVPFPSVIAVEAKLQDWKRGLVQAYRYQQFASESWVLLDAQRVGSALRNLRRFESTGVGLASFSTGSNLYIHVKAKRRAIPENALAWRTQTILARQNGTS